MFLQTQTYGVVQALPTGHLCIYLLGSVNLIDNTECLKRSARMVSPSVSGSFRISMVFRIWVLQILATQDLHLQTCHFSTNQTSQL